MAGEFILLLHTSRAATATRKFLATLQHVGDETITTKPFITAGIPHLAMKLCVRLSLLNLGACDFLTMRSEFSARDQKQGSISRSWGENGRRLPAACLPAGRSAEAFRTDEIRK